MHLREEGRMKRIHDISEVRSDHMQVNEILDEARSENFETVIVIGFKNKSVQFKRSKVKDTVLLLGAIEAAKMQLWETT
jgi:hypothetical protein